LNVLQAAPPASTGRLGPRSPTSSTSASMWTRPKSIPADGTSNGSSFLRPPRSRSRRPTFTVRRPVRRARSEWPGKSGTRSTVRTSENILPRGSERTSSGQGPGPCRRDDPAAQALVAAATWQPAPFPADARPTSDGRADGIERRARSLSTRGRDVHSGFRCEWRIALVVLTVLEEAFSCR